MNQSDSLPSGKMTNRTLKDIQSIKTTMSNTPIRRQIDFTTQPIKIERDSDVKDSVADHYLKEKLSRKIDTFAEEKREDETQKIQNSRPNFKVKHIQIPNSCLQRIQVSKDGQYVYCGRNNLNILSWNAVDDHYDLISKGTEVKKFIDAKVTNDGSIIVIDQKTSDMIKYSKMLQPLKRVQGRKEVDLNGSQITTTLYSGDSILFIWMLGDNSIAIANPNSLAYDLIPNFFGTPSEEITPFGVIASLFEHKIVGLYIKEN